MPACFPRTGTDGLLRLTGAITCIKSSQMRVCTKRMLTGRVAEVRAEQIPHAAQAVAGTRALVETGDAA